MKNASLDDFSFLRWLEKHRTRTKARLEKDAFTDAAAKREATFTAHTYDLAFRCISVEREYQKKLDLIVEIAARELERGQLSPSCYAAVSDIAQKR